MDGFFADGALLLIHDVELRGLLDAWVAGLTDTEFIDVLPLVRRTFSTFSPPERRLIGERLAAARSGRPSTPGADRRTTSRWPRRPSRWSTGSWGLAA